MRMCEIKRSLFHDIINLETKARLRRSAVGFHEAWVIRRDNTKINTRHTISLGVFTHSYPSDSTLTCSARVSFSIVICHHILHECRENVCRAMHHKSSYLLHEFSTFHQRRKKRESNERQIELEMSMSRVCAYTREKISCLNIFVNFENTYTNIEWIVNILNKISNNLYF